MMSGEIYVQFSGNRCWEEILYSLQLITRVKCFVFSLIYPKYFCLTTLFCCRVAKVTDRQRVTLLTWRPSPACRTQQTHLLSLNLILSDRYVEITLYKIVNVEINHNICPVSAKIVSGLFQHLAVSKDLSIIFLFLV